MTEETTQAVVDTTAAVAEPTAPEGNAQGNELDSFLTEYENGTRPQTPPVQQQSNAPDLKSIQDRLERFERAEAQKQHDADYSNAIKSVKGDLDIPDYAVRGWIDAKASDNKVIQDIWNNRQNNPTALNRLLTSMKKEFAVQNNKRGTVDQDATADRAAVAHAVRGASTQTPVSQPPKLGKMTNHEFNAYLRENGINNAV